MSRKMFSFDHYWLLSFPGLLPGDNVINLIKLLTSKNPDGDIAASVALEGGYNPCDNSSTFNQTQTMKQKRSTGSDCKDGFVADVVNGLCYTVLPESTNLDDGSSKCIDTYEAEALYFNKDSQVDELLVLLTSGYCFVF